MPNWHIVDIDATGPTNADGHTFTVTTQRKNPAQAAVVTGSATFESFWNSLLGMNEKKT